MHYLWSYYATLWINFNGSTYLPGSAAMDPGAKICAASRVNLATTVCVFYT